MSKWENNSATPDLEKIVKLGEVFGVSLDELVKGQKQEKSGNDGGVGDRTDLPGKAVAVELMGGEQPAGLSVRKVVGIILLCFGFMVMLLFTIMNAFLGGLIFASPFLLCGVVCLVCKANAGLWCGWVVYLWLDAYLRWAAGISSGVIVHTGYWTAEMNYARLATGWGIFLVQALLIGFTVWRLRNCPIASGRSGRNRMILLWALWVLVGAFVAGLAWAWRDLLTYILDTRVIYQLVSNLAGICRTILLAAALSVTVRYVRSVRRNLRENKQ